MKKSILLVDDEEDIRDVLSVALMDMGYPVNTADNGNTALERYRNDQPDLVLTDIKMPGLDGIDLLRRIKELNPDTEVIMITGHGDMDLAIRSLKYGAADFVTKPINVDALEIAVRRVCEKILTREKLQEYTANLEALVREKTELQDHLSSLGLMIGSISHGIKGLLTGLDGGMYLVDKGFARENQAQIKEGWSVVQVMVERIRKMVLDILYYAKKRKLEWARVDAHRFVEELARAFEAKMDNSGIVFVKDFDPALGSFEIDAAMIYSALVNILENALDACKRCKQKQEHTVILSAKPGKDHILFTVYDNGVGMSRETRDNLFTLFFSSKGTKGTGFGLFIANKIIQQHGGEIAVKSIPGKETEFAIKIPKTLPEEAKIAPAVAT
jgi:signal transduction histidine kinase